MRFFLPLSIVMISTACADFEKWTDKSGRIAEMELQSVSKNGEVNVGKFRLKNGTAVTLDASKLSDADAKRLAEWKPEKPGEAKFYHVHGYDNKYRGDPVGGSGKDEISSFNLDSTIGFYLENPKYQGIKLDSLSVISSDLTETTKVLKWEEANNLNSTEKEKVMKFWSLGDSDVASRVGNFDGTLSDSDRTRYLYPGIYFEIQLKNDVPIHEATLEKSSLKLEITAVKAEGLKDGEISFSKKDVSRSHKDKAKIKTFQSFQFSMEGRNHKDPFVDSNNDKDLELNLKIESPYFPSGIESWELLSDGKPVKMLSDVTGSEIKVKFKYWTGIKEVKVLCEKTPDSKSSQPDPANPEEDSQ